MTRTMNKPIIVSVIICGLVLVWHLVWIASFGSSQGVVLTVSNAGKSFGDTTSWFSIGSHRMFYFGLAPLVILIGALTFAWGGRSFHRTHPLALLVTMLAALSPCVCVGVLWYYLAFSLANAA